MIAQLDLFASAAAPLPVQMPPPRPMAIGAKLDPSEAEPDALVWLSRQQHSAEDQQRLVDSLRAALARKREPIWSGADAKERKKAAAQRLDLEAVVDLYRQVFPRPWDVIVAEAWANVDEYDRNARQPTPPKERQHLLRCQLDALMREANGGTSFGVLCNDGPKRLMKALRVRARAEKRLPMWGIAQVFRFQWRGLTMIADMKRGLGVHIDEHRHAPGTLCHSSTGFRSMSPLYLPPSIHNDPESWVRAVLDAYVEGPTKNGAGMGGKLEPYMPWYASSWRDAHRRLKDVTPEYRAAYPAMVAEEDRPAHWAQWEEKTRAEIARCEAKARARGVDLQALFPELQPPAQASLL